MHCAGETSEDEWEVKKTKKEPSIPGERRQQLSNPASGPAVLSEQSCPTGSDCWTLCPHLVLVLLLNLDG